MNRRARLAVMVALPLAACGRTSLFSDAAPAPPAPDCATVFDLRLTLFTRETIAWIDDVAVRADGTFVFAGGSSFAEPEAGYSFNFWSGAVDNGGRLLWSGKDNWHPNHWPVLRQGARALRSLGDGSIVVAGTLQDALRLSRRAPDGQLAWTQTFDGPGVVDEIFGLAPLSGDWIVVGSHGDPKTGHTTAFVRRFDGQGQPVWTHDLAIGLASRGRSVVPLDDGGVVVGGVTYSDSPTIGKPFLTSVDGSGKVRWQQTYELPSADGATALVTLPEGGFAFVGDVSGQRKDGLLARTDTQGALVWNRSYGGPEDDLLWGLTLVDGAFPGGAGFALAGGTSSKGAGDQDAWLIRVDGNGGMLWDATYGYQYYDVAYAVAVIPAAAGVQPGFLLGGSLSIPEQAERSDAWLARTDANGVDHCGGVCGTDEALFCADGMPCGNAQCDALTTCVYSHQYHPCPPDAGP
jgi:hypothetical protein